MNWSQWLSAKVFYLAGRRCLPWVLGLSFCLLAWGLYGGLYAAPADYQQGDAFRIIYVHVPAAAFSMAVYGFMAVNAGVYLIWHVKLADVLAQAAAAWGMSLTAFALFSGSLWGKPMWGTWWIWDARLTSELILLFLYIAYLAVRQAVPGQKRAAKASAVLALIGLIDLPIIHYSVEWWNTLHQGPTLLKLARPSMAPEMLYPLLAMMGAMLGMSIVVIWQRARLIVLQRESHLSWVQSLVKQEGL